MLFVALENTGTRPHLWPREKRLNDAQFYEIGQWYKARSLIVDACDSTWLVSRFKYEQGVDLARTCTHPDAKWFCQVLDDNPVEVCESLDVLRVIFAELGDAQGGAALFFYATCAVPFPDMNLYALTRSADLGYAPAQARLSCYTSIPKHEAQEWLWKAEAQNDPEALYLMALSLSNERAGYDNRSSALKYLFNAAHAGVPAAQEHVAGMCDVYDPEKCEWYHRAALGGRFAEGYSETICRFVDYQACDRTRIASQLVYALGKTLHGNLSLDHRTLYGRPFYAIRPSSRIGGDDVIAKATQAVCLFDQWSNQTRQAVDAWTGCAIQLKHNGFPREIRKLVSEIVWASRNEGLYDQYASSSSSQEKKKSKRIT